MSTRDLVTSETRTTVSKDDKVGIRFPAPASSDIPILAIGSTTTAGVPGVKFVGPVTVTGAFKASQNDKMTVRSPVNVKKLVATSPTEVTCATELD